MEHTYSCDVYNAKTKEWDCYWVNAQTPEEAYLTCRNRLDEETDSPKDWEIVSTIEEDTGLFLPDDWE
jgi:hypothetical protein